MDVQSLNDMHDVAEYWAQCLLHLSEDDDLKVAYDMVRVVGNSHFHDWYDGPNNDTLFVELYDFVTDLEVPDGPDHYRRAKWEMVKSLSRMFLEKYPA